VGKIINNKNPKLVFIVALFLFLLGILPLLQKCNKVTNNTGIINTNKERDLKISDPTEYLIISPFIIDDDGNGDYTWSQAVNETWCNGSGIWGDPYIIEKVKVEGQGAPLTSGIHIKNSDVYFVIRDSMIYNFGQSSGSSSAGIKFENVNNGKIYRNNCSYNSVGIRLKDSNNNTISENIASKNTAWGIALFYSNNNTLSNNKANFNNVENSNDGIELQQSNGNVIISNEVIGNGMCGISLDANSNSNNILNNTALFNGDKGIEVVGGDFNLIQGNNVSFNYYGVFVSNGNFIIIMENYLEQNEDYAIQIFFSANNLIFDNDLQDNGGGIRVLESLNQTLLGNIMTGSGIELFPRTLDEATSHYIDTTNTLNGNPVFFYVNETGLELVNFLNVSQIILANCDYSLISNTYLDQIELHFSTNSIINNNSVSNNSKNGIILTNSIGTIISGNILLNKTTAINLWYSNNSEILNNIINDNYVGIHLIYSNNNTIFMNNMNNNDYGIGLETSIDNKILQNTIHQGITGIIFLYGCKYNLISHNIIDSPDIGIYLLSLPGLGGNNYNIFVENTIKNCEQIGIYFVNYLPNENNLFYENFFINNGLHVYYDLGISFNNWNTTDIGNYWDDYAGFDANDDGIGDTPYTRVGMRDNYPIWFDGPTIVLTTPVNYTILADPPDYIIEISDPNLDTMWYSINKSDYKYVIYNNGSINLSAWSSLNEGEMSIRFYANDTFSNTNYEEVVFIKDTTPPKITILAPNHRDFVNFLAPNFTIEVEELHLDALWYTIDNGKNNISFTSNSTIDQTSWETLWNNLSNNDEITLQFYAIDAAGNVGFAEITLIRFDPSDLLIPGYNVFILFVLGVVSIIFLLAKKK